jgi:hypothetical protein
MALLNNPFDPSAVVAESNYEPLPSGEYVGEILDSTIKDTKSGSGQYIELKIRISDGQYEGRQIFDRLNFLNANPKAQEIGQRQLKNLCEACGIKGALEDTQDLHGHLFGMRLGIEQDKTGQYGPRNSVKSFMPYASNKVAPAAVQKTGNGAARPWQKN